MTHSLKRAALRAGGTVFLTIVALGILWLVELLTHAGTVSKLPDGPRVVAALEAIALGALVSYVLYAKAKSFPIDASGEEPHSHGDGHSLFRVLVLVAVFTICSALVYSIIYLGDKWLSENRTGSSQVQLPRK